MSHAASAQRSTGWSGEFYFGDCWAAYRGPSGDNAPHAHAALQVTLAVSGCVAIRDSVGIRHEHNALVVRAGATHTLEPCARVIVLLCDPNSAAATPLKLITRDAEVAPLAEALAVNIEIDAGLERMMDAFAPSRTPIDKRLQSAMNFLETNPGQPIAAAAAHCGLSPARLRAIAAQDMGVPLGNWVNWRMLRRAGLALAAGASLAEAALLGGFADQAHFSRTMQRMTGLTPSTARTPLRGPIDPFKT